MRKSESRLIPFTAFAIVLTVGVLLIAVAVPVEAHHAFGAEFDPNQPLLLKGPVVRVEWVNPHTWIHMEVTDKEGEKEVWMIEGGTPNSLLRRGLKRDSIKPGQIIGGTDELGYHITRDPIHVHDL